MIPILLGGLIVKFRVCFNNNEKDEQGEKLKGQKFKKLFFFRRGKSLRSTVLYTQEICKSINQFYFAKEGI